MIVSTNVRQTQLHYLPINIPCHYRDLIYPLQFLQAVEKPYPFWIQPLTQHKNQQSTTSAHTLQQRPPDQRTWSDPHDAQYTARYVTHSECQGHDLTSIQWWRKTLLCFSFTSECKTIPFERLQWTRFDIHVFKLSYVISVILLTYRLVLQIKTVFICFLSITILVKPHGIP
jgi:hypothetical protein